MGRGRSEGCGERHVGSASTRATRKGAARHGQFSTSLMGCAQEGDQAIERPRQQRTTVRTKNTDDDHDNNDNKSGN